MGRRFEANQGTCGLEGHVELSCCGRVHSGGKAFNRFIASVSDSAKCYGCRRLTGFHIRDQQLFQWFSFWPQSRCNFKCAAEWLA